MEEEYVSLTPEHDRRERIPKRLSSYIGYSVGGFIRRTSCTGPSVNSHQNTYFSERQAEILRSFSLR